MRTLLLLLITAALLATPALASHTPTGRCGGFKGHPALGIIEFSDGTAERTFYVDDRSALYDGVWIYQESNGIWRSDGDPTHNLQRGGESVLNPILPDTLDSKEICVDDRAVIPDTLLY